MNNGQDLEYKRVYRRSIIGLFSFMLRRENMRELAYYRNGIRYSIKLKGESMKECNYCKRLFASEFGRSICSACQDRYRPAKTTVLATPTDKRYFKLHNGNILDTENKMILSGEVLKGLLDG